MTIEYDRICCCRQGLISVNISSRRIEILSNSVSQDSALAPDSHVSYSNDLDVASDGTIYFSDSSGITPQLNRQGYYDTMRAFSLTASQVLAPDRSSRVLLPHLHPIVA